MGTFDVNPNDEIVKAVCFSNGRVDTENCHGVKLNCFAETASSTRKENAKKIVSTEIEGLTYVGKNFGSSNRFPTDMCDYYLGVRDTNTGKIRVMPLELYHMEPRIEDVYAGVENNTLNDTYRQKTDSLAKAFGSHKSKRAVKKRENEHMDEEMLMMTTKTVINSSQTQFEQEQASEKEPETSMIPPHNKDAEQPGDVYKIQDLVSSSVLSSLSQQYQVFLDCTPDDLRTWASEKKYCAFVLKLLRSLAVRADARMLQCQCLMYLQCLMHTYQIKSHHMRLKNPLPADWSAEVKKHILSKFTLEVLHGTKKSRCIPSRMKDLLMSHILVLCLKLNSCVLDLDVLQADLGAPIKRLALHCSMLGCKVSRKKNDAGQTVTEAVLKLPLTFPEAKIKTGSIKNVK